MSTYGSLHNVISLIESESYLLLYGDLYFNIDLYRLIDSYYKLNSPDIHVVTRFSDHPDDSDKIELGFESGISKFISKKEIPSPFHPSTTTTGISVINKRIFHKLAVWNGQKVDLFSQVLPSAPLINAHYYHSTELILDLGTPKRLNKIRDLLSAKKVNSSSYTNPQPCLLLDRDGVLNQDLGHICSPSELIYNDLLIEYLPKLRSIGVLIGVITNQPHVA